MAIVNYKPPLSPYIKIIYRDDDIVAVEKPSGLLSVPGKDPKHADSMINRIKRVFPTATVVHRLDMATSGVMLFSLNKDAHKHISKQFELRQTSKIYQARIYGTPATNQGSVDLPLICDWPNRPKQKVDYENGKTALTHWKLLSTSDQSSLVELYPHTGRSHQLRVHMLSLGHPILGDRLYAHDRALEMANRLQLHACQLTFTHPTTEQSQTLRSICPFSTP